MRKKQHDLCRVFDLIVATGTTISADDLMVRRLHWDNRILLTQAIAKYIESAAQQFTNMLSDFISNVNLTNNTNGKEETIQSEGLVQQVRTEANNSSSDEQASSRSESTLSNNATADQGQSGIDGTTTSTDGSVSGLLRPDLEAEGLRDREVETTTFGIGEGEGECNLPTFDVEESIKAEEESFEAITQSLNRYQQATTRAIHTALGIAATALGNDSHHEHRKIEQQTIEVRAAPA